ncbi:lisH domain and HEAT repeat-containing protein KIAA1468-like isoform X4 [Pomacea canaliculata]|uniref:lisH domain and HEAT repeat-containing protein KIAA1468-like isoform X4 n=1 Tax=Pomacea canaliculata TaxID=400727 RepID=UPI000D73D4B9|nr:lisH domain and HEAT repeat-containing protein KIAA1468-like isoform X4 [Pomacea canaliculata]
MAANLNPFEDQDHQEWLDDEIETTIPSAIKSPTPSESLEITWDIVASKLLKDNFILTALELHTELVESGRELPRLRDYFSNPGNFERTKEDTPSPTLPRTSSVQTFDSLDFARYSDDGERQVDERVAVLEFELRKAQENIKSLRATLTREAESEIVTPNRQKKEDLGNKQDDNIRPLEKKALNFLINEYLLSNNYKLTSVTFAEENEDQDFEDWDDVGLNMPKPPGVVQLFRDYGTHTSPACETQDKSCQADLDSKKYTEMLQEWDSLQNQLETKVEELENELHLLRQERDTLSQQVDILKIGSSRASAAITPVAAVKPQMLESKDALPGGRQAMPSQERHESSVFGQLESSPSSENLTAKGSMCEVNGYTAVVDMTDGSTFEETVPGLEQESACDIDSISVQENEVVEVSIPTNGKNNPRDTSWDAASGTENTKTCSKNGDITSRGINTTEKSFFGDSGLSRHLSATFQKALQQTAFRVSKDNRIVSEMSYLSKSDGIEVVSMLGRCLPHIVPNVLLGKREELIPLILATAMLHPDSKERDRLLNILFNLIKKPDDDQRQMILTGCVVFAEHVGAERLVEELLPQCWEQISHKYVERRLLVAEACGALASYLPPEMLSSLVLSMLQQMLLDDKDDDVRDAVVRSLGLLLGFITDADKYTQAYDLLQISLRDPSEKVQHTALQILLPSFAIWSFELGRLEHQLVHSTLRDLEDIVKGALALQKTNSSTTLPLNETRFLLLLSVLQELLPFLFICVSETCPSSSVQPEDGFLLDVSYMPPSSSNLSDMHVIAGGEGRLLGLVQQYESHIQQEWFEPWDQLNWLVNNLIPRMLEVMMGVGLSLPRVVSALCTFFYRFCRMFGKTFTYKKVKLKFKELVDLPEECLDSQVSMGHTAITTCIVPVYASGVLLSFSTEESRKEVSLFLKKVLCTLAFCQTSLDSLRAAFLQLKSDSANHELLLGVLWDGVVHSASVVRATAASLFELLIQGVSDALISHRVVPALVTLANDPEVSVRMATIPSLGGIIENVTIREVLDRVYMQLQTFFDDPMYREHHAVLVELIRTLARCGPNAEPKFQDEFILPRLAAIASANNQTGNETKKADIARQLFDAYSAMSCCFLNEQLIQEAMLPGLRCLRQDLASTAPEHEEVVSSMIRDYEAKLMARPESYNQDKLRTSSVTSGSGEDMKARVMSRIKDTTAKANISNIFTRKK